MDNKKKLTDIQFYVKFEGLIGTADFPIQLLNKTIQMNTYLEPAHSMSASCGVVK